MNTVATVSEDDNRDSTVGIAASAERTADAVGPTSTVTVGSSRMDRRTVESNCMAQAKDNRGDPVLAVVAEAMVPWPEEFVNEEKPKIGDLMELLRLTSTSQTLHIIDQIYCRDY